MALWWFVIIDKSDRARRLARTMRLNCSVDDLDVIGKSVAERRNPVEKGEISAATSNKRIIILSSLEKLLNWLFFVDSQSHILDKMYFLISSGLSEFPADVYNNSRIHTSKNSVYILSINCLYLSCPPDNYQLRKLKNIWLHVGKFKFTWSLNEIWRVSLSLSLSTDCTNCTKRQRGGRSALGAKTLLKSCSVINRDSSAY